MKFFTDGDQLAIVKDNFIDLQSSPAVFFPLESAIARTVLEEGIIALPLGDLWHIRDLLAAGESGFYGGDALLFSQSDELQAIVREMKGLASVLPKAMQIYALGLDGGWSVFEAHRPCMVGQGRLIASGLTEDEMSRFLKRREVVDTELKASRSHYVGVRSKELDEAY